MSDSFDRSRTIYPPATSLIDVIGHAVPLSAPVNPSSLRIVDPGYAGVLDVVDLGGPRIRHSVGNTPEPVESVLFELCDLLAQCSWHGFEIDIAQGPTALDLTWRVPTGVQLGLGLFHIDDLSWARFGDGTRYTAPLHTIEIVRAPANGSVSVLGDVSFRYWPTEGFEGVDSFEYRACDATSLCDNATITLLVGDETVLPPTPTPTLTPSPTPTPTQGPPPGVEGCTIWGTSGDDTLTGTDGDDVICGLGGNDTIFGGAGDDLLLGGSGDDELLGQAGSDKLRGGKGADILRGGSGRDRIWGNSGPDGLWGNKGRDLLYGGSGDDRIRGGLGADRASGASGKDRIWGGAGSDLLYGKKGKDRLKGGGGADRLWGGSGRDVLVGGARFDRLNGGAGFDVCAAPDMRLKCESA